MSSNWWDQDRTYRVSSSQTSTGRISNSERRKNLERDLNSGKNVIEKMIGAENSLLPYFMLSVFTLTTMLGSWMAGCAITVIKEGWPTDE